MCCEIRWGLWESKRKRESVRERERKRGIPGVEQPLMSLLAWSWMCNSLKGRPCFMVGIWRWMFRPSSGRDKRNKEGTRICADVFLSSTMIVQFLFQKRLVCRERGLIFPVAPLISFVLYVGISSRATLGGSVIQSQCVRPRLIYIPLSY